MTRDEQSLISSRYHLPLVVFTLILPVVALRRIPNSTILSWNVDVHSTFPKAHYLCFAFYGVGVCLSCLRMAFEAFIELLHSSVWSHVPFVGQHEWALVERMVFNVWKEALDSFEGASSIQSLF
jgi:hypothetical protein